MYFEFIFFHKYYFICYIYTLIVKDFMLKSLTLEKTYQYLLIFLAFLLPLTVFGANVIILLIVIIWPLSGDYKNKFNQIIKSKLMLASILFFFLHCNSAANF